MIYLDRKEKKPLYQQLYEAIIAEIHDGTLKTDDALKPIRFLADELNISLNTVQKATSGGRIYPFCSRLWLLCRRCDKQLPQRT